MSAGFRIDWARPVVRSLPGERGYHVTDGQRHLLVVVTEAQIHAATALAASLRERNPEASMQDALEEAIAAALERDASMLGEIRLQDEDFR